jgi:hypothetical protein
MMKQSLGVKFFFAIFDTFGRYITNLRDTFVENVKIVQYQLTLLYTQIILKKRFEKSKKTRLLEGTQTQFLTGVYVAAPVRQKNVKIILMKEWGA